MSHFNVYLADLGVLTEESLKAAIELFARGINAQVFYNESPDRRYMQSVSRKCTVGFTTTDCPHGIAFRLNAQGKLEVIGDEYMQATGFNKYKKLVTSGAVTNAYKATMQARRMQLRTTMTVQDDRVRLVVENA